VGLPLSIFYVVARRVLSLVVLRFRSEGSKDLELVVLRHELSVLRLKGPVTLQPGLTS
jgi:hypothetical protein